MNPFKLNNELSNIQLTIFTSHKSYKSPLGIRLGFDHLNKTSYYEY